MALADTANRYIDDQKPWVLAKDPEQTAALHEVCTQALNLFRILVVALKPVLPSITLRAEEFLNAPTGLWPETSVAPLLEHRIQTYAPLFTRLDPKRIQVMLDDSALPADKGYKTIPIRVV